MIMTFCLSIAFVCRISSPVGWVPLLLWKIFAENCFEVFLKAGMTISLPVLGFAIAIDSIYYGKLTFSIYAFLKFNILENKSRFFGVSPWHEYLRLLLPDALKYSLFVVLAGMIVYGY